MISQTLSQYLKYELFCEYTCKDEQKDIFIVIKDGLDFVRPCIESVLNNTENFTLHLWDNGSNEPTRDYLKNLESPHIRHYRSEENLGFIQPNNRMAEMAEAPYLILLNSDTIVQKGWDKAMLGYLQEHEGFGAIGYEGGILGSDGWGTNTAYGENIDYLMGWSLCVPKPIYDRYGLFDEENLVFAYFEDSDFSLRLKEGGEKIYALHLDYVRHLRNRTVREVANEVDIQKILVKNWRYFRKHWEKQLNEPINFADNIKVETLCYT